MAALWKSHPALMDRALTAQNHPANRNRDILTFCGFCDSVDELRDYVERLEAEIANRPVAVLRTKARGITKGETLPVEGEVS